MSTWWSLAPRADLGLHASLQPATRPFAITNRGWYVLHRFLVQAGAPSTHLMVGPHDSFVPSRIIVHWGQMVEKLAYGDWYMVSRFDGRAVSAVGIIHTSQLDTVSDDLELTPLFGTPTYNWLLSIGQELLTAPSAYLITGKPRKGNPMSVSLVKGQKVTLTDALDKAGVADSGSVTVFTFGSGWDARTGAGEEFDLDLCAFALDSNGKAVGAEDAACFFGHLTGVNGALNHSGDNLTGAGDGDDETITVDTSKIAADVAAIHFYCTIYQAGKRGNLNFGQVNNAFIRVEANGTEILRYDLSEDAGPVPTLEFGKLYRDPNGAWAFKPIVNPYNYEVDGIFTAYGIPFATS